MPTSLDQAKAVDPQPGHWSTSTTDTVPLTRVPARRVAACRHHWTRPDSDGGVRWHQNKPRQSARFGQGCHRVGAKLHRLDRRRHWLDPPYPAQNTTHHHVRTIHPLNRQPSTHTHPLATPTPTLQPLDAETPLAQRAPTPPPTRYGTICRTQVPHASQWRRDRTRPYQD